VSEHGGNWSAVVLKTASCVVGDEVIFLPDDVKPGDIVECHGIKQRVTYEYGAYALEKV
jgi:hypothetical protein